MFDTDAILLVRFGLATEPVSTLAVTASPFIWKNQTGGRLLFSVSGGTVSDVSVSRNDGAGFTTVRTASSIYLNRAACNHNQSRCRRNRGHQLNH
jgi:hypothetical protein